MRLNEHTYRDLIAGYRGSNLIADLPDALSTFGTTTT
jgi:hypothetical protein